MRGIWNRLLRRPRWSVRSRIVASMLFVSAIGLVVAGTSAYVLQRERTLIEIDERLLSRVDSARFVVTGISSARDGASVVATDPDAPIFATTTDALESILSRVIPGRNESSLGIINGVARFVPGVEIDFRLESDPTFIARVVNEVSDDTVRVGTAVSPLGELRYIASPISVAGDTETGVYVTAIDVQSELRELTHAFRTYAFVALTALVAIGLVGWFVAGKLLQPIRQLRAAASRITAQERNERIPVAGNDDVSELTGTVNDMLDRLDAALTGQRQLLDDVRHELKTPITILRGHLELLDAESQHPVHVFVPTDLADLTTDVFAKAAGIPGHRWVLGETAQVSATIDPMRITQAWLQLVDNAAKYSAAGTTIVIGSTAECSTSDPTNPHSVEFWVADQGPGIPAGSEERIFERFGRVDAGRGIQGSGLGLPIVRTIAIAHGGNVRLCSSTVGSRFGILLPLTEATEREETDEP
jgi:two-component system OmpR family sensor kinase